MREAPCRSSPTSISIIPGVARARSGRSRHSPEPGNLVRKDKIARIVARCRERNTPVRIGVNNGSLRAICARRCFAGEMPTHVAMVESALDENSRHRGFGLRADQGRAESVGRSHDRRRLSPHGDKTAVPFHVGLTEAGTVRGGNGEKRDGHRRAASSMACATTIRVSLYGPIRARSLRSRAKCWRNLDFETPGELDFRVRRADASRSNFERAAQASEERLDARLCRRDDFRVRDGLRPSTAPAKEQIADFGIPGGRGRGAIYRLGKVVRTCREDEMVASLFEEIDRWIAAGRPREEVDAAVSNKSSTQTEV